jgi:hypothetical protein
MIRGFKGALCLGLLLSAGTALAAESNQQAKCINKINKDTIKVLAAKGKLGGGCVKDAVKTSLTPGAAATSCLAADAKGKVSGKKAKTVSDEMKNCSAPLPDFAYTSAANANADADNAGGQLMQDVFGVSFGALLPCDTNPKECLCQRQAIDRVVKMFNAANQIFVKCKKFALAIGHDPFPLGASSAADIEKCATGPGSGLSVAEDPGAKIADAGTQLGDTVTKFCGQTPNDEFAIGRCAGLSNANRTICLEDRVFCRFCLMVNGADNLAINCDVFDDGVTNGSCP